MTDENGQSKGFGFVHFETQESANNAISKVNSMLLAGKKVYVGPFIPRSQRNDGGGARKFTNIFVKNFGDQLDDEKLKELFTPYGTISSCVVSERPEKSNTFMALLFTRWPKMTLENRKDSAFAVSKVRKKQKRSVTLMIIG